jgi:Flp pilus assembly protein TadD
MRNAKQERNLEAIKETNPNLYEWIKKQPKQDWVRQIKSDDGAANLLISVGSQTVAAYRMKGAKKDALKATKNMRLHKENVSILIGFGLGYLARAILDKMEHGHKLVIIEPVGHIMKLALSNFDFAKEIKAFRLLIIKPEEKDISSAFGILDVTFMVNDWLLTVNKYTKLRPDDYLKSMKLVMDTLNQIMCSVGTIAGTAGAKIADNDIVCLPYVIRHRGVSELSGLFKEKPAILVSTGPSLAKNIHQLIEVGKRGSAVIIAVGQALRVLLAYDIKPDFICTVDFGEVNMGHFIGLMDSEVPLVTINRAYAPLLKAWKGPKFIAATPVPGYEDMAAGILKDKGFLEAGGSVAHLCFALAQSLGCNPIIFVGQDLALSETSHIPLADAAGEVVVSETGQIGWKVKDQRCSLHGKQEIYGMGPVHQVDGYYGKPVMTNLGLASFITSFEGMASRCEAEVINATEGGANIKHTKKMMLKEVIQKYCQPSVTNRIDKSKLEKLKSLADDGDELIEKVIPLLKKDIENLEVIIKSGGDGLATARELSTLMSQDNYKGLLTKEKRKMLKQLLKESAETAKMGKYDLNLLFYDRLIKQLNKSKLKTITVLSQKNYIASETTRMAAIKNPLVNVAIHGASRRIWNRDLKVDETFEHFLRSQKDALTRIERNKIILKAAVEAAKSLRESYKETLKLLEQYNDTKDESILISDEKEPINLDDAEDYFSEGNWAHPLIDARRCIKELFDLDGNDVSPVNQSYDEVKEIYAKAKVMRKDAIEKAIENEKKNYEQQKKLIEYNKLIIQSRKEGKDNQDFKTALELLRKASKLLPEKAEAKWGIATALHHHGRLDESLEVYREIIEEFPDNKRFKFEMGQVLLKLGDTKKGLESIKTAMEDTDEFDGFLARIGEIYVHAGMEKKALEAYNSYLDKFPANYEVWNLKGVCLNKLKRNGLAIKAFKTALKIKPDFEQARKNIRMLKK